MTNTQVQFNLWHEPWIRVTYHDGRYAELSIAECLATAPTIARLSDPSPLTVTGTHRLLTAILQAIYQPASLTAIAQIISAGCFDQQQLNSFAANAAARFDIFSTERPFLQSSDIDIPHSGVQRKPSGTGRKPVAMLFLEIPSVSNRTLFHHVSDDTHHICPACCARGLITYAAFATAGGPAIRPSINGVPPIYVMPATATLQQSLALSLTAPDFQPRAAEVSKSDLEWLGPEKIKRDEPINSISYLHSLIFPARRMRLYPYPTTGRCTLCGGELRIAVSEMTFEMGHRLAEGHVAWDDPFVAYRRPRAKNAVELLPLRPEEGKALWREYSTLLLAEIADAQLRPKIVQQLGRLLDNALLPESEDVAFRCTGLRTDGKAKYFEWYDETLAAPPVLLQDPATAEHVNEALSWANDVRFIIESSFDHHFRPERAEGGHESKLTRFKSVKQRMTATYWQTLQIPFRHFIRKLATVAEPSGAASAWATTLITTAQQVLEQTAQQVGSGANALRARVGAVDECRRRLYAKHKEWLNGGSNNDNID